MRDYYLKKADENLPVQTDTVKTSETVVEIYEDETKHMGIGFKTVGKIKDELEAGDKFILDFGDHCVGKISFRLAKVKTYLDAPVKLKLKFAEVPYDMSRDFNTFYGTLCQSWLQEETINVDYEGLVEMPRRYAFRFVEVKVLATPRKIRLSDFKVNVTTCADESNMEPLPEGTDPMLVRIDKVAARTLADCMQEVYEDGPKRDRRLWTGDLRVQALTDSVLYKNKELAKRCMYLFAACQKDGQYLPGCLYYKPELFYDEGMGISDYALLYAVTLCDYYENYGDKETALDLYPIAAKQIDLAMSIHDENGIITFLDGWVAFIDWAEGIKKRTAVQGVYLYALEKMGKLARDIGKTEDADRYKAHLELTRKNAYEKLFNKEKNAFINDYDENQYSVQAQVWMILGGVIGGEEAKEILQKSLKEADVIPTTPYMHHYVMEAMIKLGMKDKALDYMKSYWGKMVELGADTFWETFVPAQPELTYMKDPLLNSWCHAWSCSPSYFIRKYFI